MFKIKNFILNHTFRFTGVAGKGILCPHNAGYYIYECANEATSHDQHIIYDWMIERRIIT